MHGDDHVHGRFFWHGPRLWLASAATGALAGWALARLLPAAYPAGANAPTIPWPLILPFAILLASIAVVPLLASRWWHRHFPDVAFFLGALVASYYLIAYSIPGYDGSLSYGQSKTLHSALEFYSFIALVGGLFVVSGGIFVDLPGRGGPVSNSLFFLAGAVLANLIGTTGASVLLIRPFMRANDDRLRPFHVVFFIFIVSNCGGSLTPIGDPPLYLGFLKGVPFFWVLRHLWQDWALVIGVLTLIFFFIDARHERRLAAAAAKEGRTLPPPAVLPAVRLRGVRGLLCLVLMVAAVFADPLAHRYLPWIGHFPLGATIQIAVAAAAYFLAPRDILERNDFTFFPVKEVGMLFAGIFLTMMPALGYLSANGARLGIDSPTSFYFATGSLSAMLDNAPTYLNFLQVATAPEEVSPASIRAMLATMQGETSLIAISTAAVFFGAMTYIGNGPNFMVRTIAEAHGVRMPSFFAYVLWAAVFLLPVLVLHWAVFIR